MTLVLTQRRMLAAGALGLYMLGLTFALGLVTERIRLDRERTAVLAHYDEAIRQWHQFLMQAETQAQTESLRAAVAR